VTTAERPRKKPAKLVSTDTVPKSAARPQPKGGSRKGIPNKATANAREAIGRFVDGNADRLNGWLDEIYAADGPKAAFNCFADLLEYHVPKLARTELTGPGGGALQVNVVNLTDPTEQAGAWRKPQP
jgi:hypothetical protein